MLSSSVKGSIVANRLNQELDKITLEYSSLHKQRWAKLILFKLICSIDEQKK